MGEAIGRSRVGLELCGSPCSTWQPFRPLGHVALSLGFVSFYGRELSWPSLFSYAYMCVYTWISHTQQCWLFSCNWANYAFVLMLLFSNENHLILRFLLNSCLRHECQVSWTFDKRMLGLIYKDLIEGQFFKIYLLLKLFSNALLFTQNIIYRNIINQASRWQTAVTVCIFTWEILLMISI